MRLWLIIYLFSLFKKRKRKIPMHFHCPTTNMKNYAAARFAPIEHQTFIKLEMLHKLMEFAVIITLLVEDTL